ncbi:MAG: GMC family oxidoreductase N-terminal domain-containing protein [Cytophagaceae bacterium]|nr:GMC family oxidoreductase N-terminal domain-containing protein [Cytophagaceae bacterium]
MKFDYIIVGAGSAGCVLANRLSANPKNQVLLLEAGGKDRKMEIHIPAAYPKLHHSEVNWNFFTEPQAFVRNRRMYQPRGKALGGSSSINAMAYIRGNREDYNDWERMGCAGWGYTDMLMHFKKSENNEQFRNAFHGQGGLLNVTHNRYVTPLAEAFVAACEQQGIPANPDFNGRQQDGAGRFQFTVKNARRHSTATAFLKPILAGRRNLHVMTGAHTHRVLLNGHRVTGVEVSTRPGGPVEVVHANKDVILTAGSFQSPQLLLLSGIGPADYLNDVGISVRHALPGVGENLQDHLFVNTNVLCNQRITYNNAETPRNLLRYFLFKQGPFAASPLEAGAFVRTLEGLDRTDIQFHFAPVMGYDLHDYSSLPKTEGFTILPTLLKPKSRGWVRLHSTNPLDAPLIQPNYLSNADDLDTLVRGFKKAREVLLSDAFAPYRSENQLHFPEVSATDEQIIEHILAACETVYHPVGTCKMGVDVMAVVDPGSLKVRGLEGLRVADASIMPTIVAGNTNAPVMAIAEKAAELILERDLVFTEMAA